MANPQVAADPKLVKRVRKGVAAAASKKMMILFLSGPAHCLIKSWSGCQIWNAAMKNAH